MTELEIKGFTDGYMAKQAEDDDRGPHSAGNRLLGAGIGSLGAASASPITALGLGAMGGSVKSKLALAALGGAIPVAGGLTAGLLGGTEAGTNVMGGVAGGLLGGGLVSIPALTLAAAAKLRGQNVSTFAKALGLLGTGAAATGGAYGGMQGAGALHDVIYDGINK